jgi:hypothetical protein
VAALPPFAGLKVTSTQSPARTPDRSVGLATKQSPVAACRPTHSRGLSVVTEPTQVRLPEVPHAPATGISSKSATVDARTASTRRIVGALSLKRYRAYLTRAGGEVLETRDDVVDVRRV